MYLCIHMHACMYVCMYVNTCVYACMHMHISIFWSRGFLQWLSYYSIDVRAYVCVCVLSVRVPLNVCSVCMYVCMYVYVNFTKQRFSAMTELTVLFMCVYECMYVHVYPVLSVCGPLNVCMYVCMYVHARAHTCTCTCMCAHKCMDAHYMKVNVN